MGKIRKITGNLKLNISANQFWLLLGMLLSYEIVGNKVPRVWFALWVIGFIAVTLFTKKRIHPATWGLASIFALSGIFGVLPQLWAICGWFFRLAIKMFVVGAVIFACYTLYKHFKGSNSEPSV